MILQLQELVPVVMIREYKQAPQRGTDGFEPRVTVDKLCFDV